MQTLSELSQALDLSALDEATRQLVTHVELEEKVDFEGEPMLFVGAILADKVDVERLKWAQLKPIHDLVFAWLQEAWPNARPSIMFTTQEDWDKRYSPEDEE